MRKPLATTIKVYPRGCGGAANKFAEEVSKGGLSPRVRGSQPLWTGQYDQSRSIPAGEGEPRARAPDA